MDDELDSLNLSGVGNIILPDIGYEGGFELEYECGREALISLHSKSDYDLMSDDDPGSGSGELTIQGKSCTIECANFTSSYSKNDCLELNVGYHTDLIIQFTDICPGKLKYKIYFSNLDVAYPVSSCVNGASIILKSINGAKDSFYALRRRKKMAAVTAVCEIVLPDAPNDFLIEWARPISKFIQSYAGTFVDVVGWSKLSEDGRASEIHLLPGFAQSYSRSQYYSKDKMGLSGWRPFIGQPLGKYLNLYSNTDLAAVSQYLSMSSAPQMTVNATSALLLLTTELMAMIYGAQLEIEWDEETDLLKKIKDILRKTDLKIHKRKREALNKIVRVNVRNPLVHTGLPDRDSVGTLDNAKVNCFLRNLCVALQSLLIGCDAEHCFTHWNKQLYMKPSEWLANHTTMI